MSRFKLSENIKLFVKYSVVGSVGAAVNFAVFHFFFDVFGAHHVVAASGSFLVAAYNNYLINRVWTFQGVRARPRLISGYRRYVLGNLAGLATNLLVLTILVYLLGEDAVKAAQIAGIAGGAIVNFLFAKLFVFADVDRSRQAERRG